MGALGESTARILCLGGVRCVPVDGVHVQELPALPVGPLTSSEGWTLALVPHERWAVEGGGGGGDGAQALIRALGSLGEEVHAVQIPRVEPSATGARISLPARAWRGLARPRGDLVDLDLEVDGACVVAQGVQLLAERWAWDDPRGRAEQAEQEGDLVGGALRWAALADAERGPRRAWCLTRAAALYQLQSASSQEACRLLHAALRASPRLPEALLRLAEGAIASGEVEEGLAWAELASTPQALPGLAHLEGTGAWLVPARLALALHRRADLRCGPIASAALKAGARGDMARALEQVVHARSQPDPYSHAPQGGADHG